MKCSNCGAELSEGALFCANCGTRVQAPEAVPVTPNEPVNPVPTPEAVPMTSSEPVNPAPTPQPAPMPQPMSAPQVTPVMKKKSNKGVLIGVIVGVVALVCILAAFFLPMLLKSKAGGEKMIVYMKAGTLYYSPNMDKDKEAVEVDSSIGGFNNVSLSADGKYLYYISDDMRGTFQRAELGKLKNGSKKNSKYITEIDSGVDSYQLIGEDQLIYRTYDGRLYLYDGEEENDIDRDVTDISYVLDDVLYYTTYRNGERVYNYYNLKEEEGDSYARDVDIISHDWKNKTFYYQKDDAIYVSNLEGDEEELAKDVSWVVSVDAPSKTIFFVRQRTENNSLYNYVQDDLAAKDESFNQPVKNDYLVKVSEKDVLTAQDYDYYEEYPDSKKNFYKNGLYDDYETGLKTYYNWEKSQKFFYVEKKWYTVDQEKYDADCEEYRLAQNRITLRGYLKEQTYEEYCSDLYVIKNDESEELLAKNIEDVFANASLDLAVYVKMMDLSTRKLDITEVEGTYSVWEMLNNAKAVESKEASSYWLAGEESALDSLVVGMNGSVDNKRVILYSETDADEQEDGYSDGFSAACYMIEKDGLAIESELSMCDDYGMWMNDTFYYPSAVSDDYGDYVAYKNGKEETILKNVSVSSIRIYPDGNYTAYKNMSDRDLCLYNKDGEDTRISKNVDSYTYINDKRIVYVRDGSLYVYTGEEEDRRIERYIDSNRSYWCKGYSYR